MAFQTRSTQAMVNRFKALFKVMAQYLHQQKVVTSITSPISKIYQYLAALMHVDDTYLYVFNDGSMSAQEVVIKSKKLLNAWHEDLKHTGGDLKLSKCY